MERFWRFVEDTPEMGFLYGVVNRRRHNTLEKISGAVEDHHRELKREFKRKYPRGSPPSDRLPADEKEKFRQMVLIENKVRLLLDHLREDYE